MAIYSYKTVPGDDSTLVHTFSFHYLEREHIHCYDVDAEGNETEVDFTFQTAFTVELSAAITTGNTLKIARVTPINEAVVTFQDGSVLAASDLNPQALQVLFAVQEGLDNNTDVVTIVESLLDGKADWPHVHGLDGNVGVVWGLAADANPITGYPVLFIEQDTSAIRVVDTNGFLVDKIEPLDLAADYTWTGNHDFTSGTVSVSTPNNDTDVATKKYADDTAQAAAQAAAQSYTDNKIATLPRHLIEWTDPSPDHPYLNTYNETYKGKATIVFPGNADSYLNGQLIVPATGRDIKITLKGMMSTAESVGLTLGLAYAVSGGGLVDVPWQRWIEYPQHARITPQVPNGCEYEADPGGYNANPFAQALTGGIASASQNGANAALALDDNGGTEWSTTGPASVGDYWEYDLGAGNSAVARYLKVYRLSVSGVTQLALQGSDNGVDWTTLRTLYYDPIAFGGTREERLWIDGDTPYRRFRLYAEAVDGIGGMSFAELSISENGEPTWPTGLGQTVTDNQITWHCVSTNNFLAAEYGIKAAPAEAGIEGDIEFIIPGAALVAGDMMHLLLWRRIDDNPAHGGNFHISSGKYQAVEV